MLTIKTTGDDAWDTDARLLDALRNYYVTVEGDARTFEVRGCNDQGYALLQPLTSEGNPLGEAVFIDAHNITINVL